MGEEHTNWEIDLQAQALAEKTVNAPLEALAQLCTMAEALIDKVLRLPDEVPEEARDLLGLHTMEDLREFFDNVIFKVHQSPQDVLAQFLFQGRAARDAGVPPKEWIKTHRLVHLATLKISHHFRYRSELPEEVRQTFFLADERNYMALLSLHERSSVSLPERFRLLREWALHVRKAAARGLLLRAQMEHDRLAPAGLPMPRSLERRSARIPLNRASLRPVEHALA
jgi:hypothetical protein